MATTGRRYPQEEIARRGDLIYQTQIRPSLQVEDDGKFVAIDIETNNYEMAHDELTAGDRLHARIPDAQVWMVKVGSPYVRKFGGRQLRGKSL
jgi:hypothetical protein